MIAFGEQTISSVYFGENKIDSVYKGLEKVYSSGVNYTYTGNWLVEDNVFTSNTITHDHTTVERIKFKSAKGYKIKLTWDMSSE